MSDNKDRGSEVANVHVEKTSTGNYKATVTTRDGTTRTREDSGGLIIKPSAEKAISKATNAAKSKSWW